MNLDLSKSQIAASELTKKEFQKKIKNIHETIHSQNYSLGTTWVDWPENYDKKELAKIQKLASEISSKADILLVVGIGGSYLGTKAGIDMLAKNSKFKIVFAGINFSYADLSDKLEMIKDKEIYVNIVSKSGTTVEILAANHIVEKFIKNKYKTEYKKHIIYTTDKENGYLRKKANFEGIETLSVPAGMGGRFSVLSAVGLLPFACAGIKIKQILEGAQFCRNQLLIPDIEHNDAYKYAIYRYLLNKKLGKKVELFATFFPELYSFEFWLQQLFAESEGKDKQGLFVAPLAYSTDLHSVGQFLQQGTPILAETFLSCKTCSKDTILTTIPLDSPIKYLDGKKYSEICSPPAWEAKIDDIVFIEVWKGV